MYIKIKQLIKPIQEQITHLPISIGREVLGGVRSRFPWQHVTTKSSDVTMNQFVAMAILVARLFVDGGYCYPFMIMLHDDL